MMTTDVTALILAGGRATRMGGVDKRGLVVEGRTIFARQCEVLAPRVAEIVVSVAANAPETSGYRTVRDAVAGAGPLAGIAAGLAAARTAWVIVVAADMPYVAGALVDRMLAAAVEASEVVEAVEAVEAVDAVGLRAGGLPEPLLCVLRVAPARAAVERLLAARRFKASALLTDEGLRVVWLDDADPRALVNVNAPGDLPKA